MINAVILKKYTSAKIWIFIIHLRSFLSFGHKKSKTYKIESLFDKYQSKKKIVICCNGPSASDVNFNSDNLYLTTNSGYLIMKDHDFLFYINDPFYLKKTLATDFLFLKINQEILLYFDDSELHKNSFSFFHRFDHVLKRLKTFYISDRLDQCSATNYLDFHTFYSERNLPIKIQNSGVFLLLFGYYMAFVMDLPLEIYGLDLGLGGAVHFNNKGLVGESVLKERVKINVKMYLDYMYSEKKSIDNFSNFYNNQKPIIE